MTGELNQELPFPPRDPLELPSDLAITSKAGETIDSWPVLPLRALHSGHIAVVQSRIDICSNLLVSPSHGSSEFSRGMQMRNSSSKGRTRVEGDGVEGTVGEGDQYGVRPRKVLDAAAGREGASSHPLAHCWQIQRLGRLDAVVARGRDVDRFEGDEVHLSNLGVDEFGLFGESASN